MTRQVNQDLADQVAKIEKAIHSDTMKRWRHDAFREYSSDENPGRYRDFTNGYIIQRHTEFKAQQKIDANPVPPSCRGNMQLDDGMGNYD